MPRCVIFDDLASLAHLLAGALSVLLGPLWALGGFTLYTIYEVVEGRYRRDCPSADIIEYLVGLGAGALIKSLLALSGVG